VAYTSLADLIDRHGERQLIGLTDRGDVATDTIDTDVVDAALADTDALINGHLAAKYQLPLSTVDPLIRDLAKAIAIYKLHVYEPNGKIVQDYKDALVTLRDIARGVVQLRADGVAPATTGGGGAQVTDRERPMTEDSLKGFI